MNTRPPALHLRRAIVRNGLISAVLCLVISLVLNAFVSDQAGLPNLLWPIVLALGVGVFTAGQMIWKVKRGVVNSVPYDLALRKIDRAEMPDADWKSIDDYGAQLASRGYVAQGDYVVHPATAKTRAVAAMYIHQSGMTLVEIQHVLDVPDAKHLSSNHSDIHFTVTSLISGTATASVTSRDLLSVNNLFRIGGLSVVVSMPNTGLMEMLDAHTKMLAKLKVKSGHLPQSDLTMERYALGQRKYFRQARQRMSKMNGWQMAQSIDVYDANPVSFWAPDMNALRALTPQALATLEQDASLTAVPGIVSISAAAAQANTPEAVTDTDIETLAQMEQRPAIESAASWFYWIAGLTLVNAVVSAFGSDWAFMIGSGVSMIISALAGSLSEGASDSIMPTVLLSAVNLALIAGIVWCGRTARRPSVSAFAIGGVLYALDGLLVLFIGDYLGAAFHALALYFIWRGFQAARAYQTVGA
jgi:hypothetical protein